MPRDDDDDSWNEDDYDDLPDDADPELQPCPYCGEQIYEDAERCPHCDRYISEETRRARPKPWWVIVGVIVCLYLAFRWMFP